VKEPGWFDNVNVNYTVDDTYALLKEAVSHKHPNVKLLMMILTLILILVLIMRH
jgi:hypothetical protein